MRLSKHTFLGLIVFFLFFSVPQTSQALIQIMNMNDFNLGTWSGSGNLTASDNICVWEDTGNVRYRITARGSGTGNAFTLSGGASTLPYSVTWQGTVGGATTLIANTGVGFRASAGTFNCGGSTNAIMQITVLATDLQTVEAANYSGTLTIVAARN